MLHLPRQFFAYFFVSLAILMCFLTLFLSDRLVKELAREEQEKMEVWALATETLASESGPMADEMDVALILRILEGNRTIPLILFDADTGERMAHNIKVPEKNSESFLEKKMHAFGQKHEPIVLREMNQLLYYDDSRLLRQLQLYPFLQLVIISLFIGLAFLALNRSRRAEQNRVWVGLSKETAHQLGTPISSLMAWSEYLKLKQVDRDMLSEIDKDIARLQMIAERFSKIGSATDLDAVDLHEALERSLNYMKKRVSREVEFRVARPARPVQVKLNEPLFNWVIENLVKNGVDAMQGKGAIAFAISEKGRYAYLDISDTGKGMPRSMFNTIFQPGYTTKERGWGLGLSLVKRIVEKNHEGKIWVKRSEPGVGTTFRIAMKKVRS